MKINSDDPDKIKIGATRKELYAGFMIAIWICERVF